MFNIGVNYACNRRVHGLFTVTPVNKNSPIARALQLAKGKGMNQSGFAAAMGVSPQDVTNWKKRGLPADRLEKASEVVGCSMDELAKGPDRITARAQSPKGGPQLEGARTGGGAGSNVEPSPTHD